MPDGSHRPDPQTRQRVEVVVGDITTLSVDAIVNAANQSLMGGGGVDGAIHRAAGPELKAHNETLGGCDTGDAKISPAFNLTQNGIEHIIHTVGPVWANGSSDENAAIGENKEDALLAHCYDRCLQLARDHNCKTLAFPAISTGVYGFPKARAARIAVHRVTDFLAKHDCPGHVTFCCFAQEDKVIYERVLG